MAVKVRIPAALRPYAANQREIEVAGSTVGEVVRGLTRAHPGLAPHLLDEAGALRSFVNVYVNNEDARGRGGAEAPVKLGDTILIVPSVAGG